MKMSRLAAALIVASLPLFMGCGSGGGGSASSRLSSINGRVINERDQPVSSAEVSLMPASNSRAEVITATTTSVDGTFSMDDLQAGTYTLSVRASVPGGGTVEVQVSITVPEGSDVDVEIRIIMDSSAPGGGGGVVDPGPSTGAVIGHVFDSLGRPAPGATVTIRFIGTGETLTTTTNSLGEFFLDDLRVGAWQIHAATTLVQSAPFLINVRADTLIQTDIYLPSVPLPPGVPPGTGGSGGVGIPGNGHAKGHLIGLGHQKKKGNGHNNGNHNHD